MLYHLQQVGACRGQRLFGVAALGGIDQRPDHFALGLFGVQQRAPDGKPALLTMGRAHGVFHPGLARGAHLRVVLARLHKVGRVPVKKAQVAASQRLAVAREHVDGALVAQVDGAVCASDDQQGPGVVEQGAAQLRIGTALADVGQGAHDACAIAAFQGRGLAPQFHPAPGAAGAAQAQLQRKWLAQPHLALQQVQRLVAVVGVDGLAPVCKSHAVDGTGVAQNVLAARIKLHVAAGGVPLPQAIAHGSGGHAQALFAAAQGVVGSVLLGDVVDVAVPQRAAVGLALGVGVACQPVHLAVGQQRAVFAHPGREMARRRHDAVADALAVFGVDAVNHLAAIAHGLLRRQAIHIADTRAGVRKAAVAVRTQAVLVHGARHLRHQLAQARLQLGLQCLALAPGRDVREGAKDALGPPALAALAHLAAHVQPAPLAAVVAQAQLARKAVDLATAQRLDQGIDAGAVVRMHQRQQALQALLHAVGRQAQQVGQVRVHAQALGTRAPVPDAQGTALQRQLVALFVFLEQRAVLLHAPQQQRHTQERQHDEKAAHGVAPQTVLDGAVRGGQGVVTVQPHDDDQRVLLEPAPGVVAIHAVDGIHHPVFAAHRLRRGQKNPVFGHGLVQHLVQKIRACQVGAIGAHQQGHVAARAKQLAKPAGNVFRRHGQHHHPRKAPVAFNGIRELDAPLPRHPAQYRLADKQPGLPALRVYTEILPVGNRHRPDAGGLAGVGQTPRSICHAHLDDAVLGKRFPCRALGQQKSPTGVVFVGGSEILGQVLQPGHQRADLGSHVGRQLHGALAGLAFYVSQPVCVVAQQMQPIDSTHQQQQHTTQQA